ncbi:MAG: hypothetical protein V7609_3399 [Verrucomicrobiota bacterium]
MSQRHIYSPAAGNISVEHYYYDAMSRLSSTYRVFAALVQLPLCYVIASDNGTTASPEETDKSFVRRFDFGRWATPFVDDDCPPVLELVTLSGGPRLMTWAEYHNRDSSGAKKVEGRQITEWWTDGPLFWPYVRLEVSNEREGGWTVIGASPPAKAEGATKAEGVSLRISAY